jgi:lipopolysaccharide export system protein LptA
MKNFLLRLASAAVICTLSMVALDAQTASQAPARDSQQPSASQQQNDPQTQDAKAFSGTIVKEKGMLVLKDGTANVSYQLDNQEKAKAFEGKQVKVTGKLDMDTNLIHVENIEVAS